MRLYKMNINIFKNNIALIEYSPQIENGSHHNGTKQHFRIKETVITASL